MNPEQPGAHHLSCHGGLDATDLSFPDESSLEASSNRRLGLQSSGSSVQVPLGQSEAPMAEHSPVQLVPWPHVTLVRVVLGEQQPTSIDSFVNVNAESKKSTSVKVELPKRDTCKKYRFSTSGSEGQICWFWISFNISEAVAFERIIDLGPPWQTTGLCT